MTEIISTIPDWAGKPGQKVKFTEAWKIHFADWANILRQGAPINEGDTARIATGFVKNNRVTVYHNGNIIHGVPLSILMPI